jgi:hypothetical protein
MLQQENVCRLVFRKLHKNKKGVGRGWDSCRAWCLGLCVSAEVTIRRYTCTDWVAVAWVHTWESGRDPSDHHNFGTFI